jgi:Tfp pilus assembly protein PilF
MRLRLPLMSAAFGVAALLQTGTAVAQQKADDERGRFHFQAGASYYEAGDYEDALREFQRAYEVSKRPELFYNLSLCHQQLGHLSEAAKYLERYLQEVENVPNRVNLERRLDNLKARLAAGEGEAPPAPGHDGQTEQPANAGQPGVGTFEGDTRAAGVDRTDAKRGVPLPAIIAWAAGGTLILGSVITGSMALSEKSRVDDLPCAPSATCTSDDVAKLNRLARTTDVLLFTGLAGAVAGTVLFFVLRGGKEKQGGSAALQISPWVDPRGGGGAVVGGTF